MPDPNGLPDHVWAPERLAALEGYGILDTPPERGFDDIVTLATQICGTSIAVVSLVDADRQWFKARIGLAACDTPLDQSVCAHALAGDDLMVIPDLSLDARTSGMEMVTGRSAIRFYAGAPLTTSTGMILGTLCVMDAGPRPDGLTQRQRDGLNALARQVMDQIELREALSERLRADERQEILKLELAHRLKNLIAMVQAIATQTLRNAPDMATAGKVLSDRLMALARAQDILFAGPAEGASLETLLRQGLAVHPGSDGQVAVDGPDVEVGAKVGLSLVLVVHELATNAVKYGALSSPDGRVRVQWEVSGPAGAEELRLEWSESGGPGVSPPTRRGFGTRLIERTLTGHVGGRIALEYPPDGARCRIEAPLAAFRSAA
jgi:two-component sensor histidine kinase